MKKISTLIVAALAICGTTSVKAQSVGKGFTTGYYKMKSIVDRNRIYVYNDEFNEVNSKKRSLVSATDAETNNYIFPLPILVMEKFQLLMVKVLRLNQKMVQGRQRHLVHTQR